MTRIWSARGSLRIWRSAVAEISTLYLAIEAEVADEIAQGAGRLTSQSREVFRVGNFLELVEERILDEARQLYATRATRLIDGSLQAIVDPDCDLGEWHTPSFARIYQQTQA